MASRMATSHNRTTQQFFALLRAGLWSVSVDRNLFEEVDWRGIARLAKKQAVVGVVADGIESLLSEKPELVKEVSDWVPLVLNIEEQNKKIDKQVCEQADLYKSQGFPFILLKGQGMARYYPQPLHRQSGDIDTYIGTKRSDEIRDFITSQGYTITYENRVHFCYNAPPTSVESHKLSHHFYCPWINWSYQKIAERELLEEKPATVQINGATIDIPNPTFNAFFLFIHLYEHFYHEGVGLRQLCDWALQMKKCEDEIDWDKVESYVGAVHAKRAWRTFFAVVKDQMGLELKPETLRRPLFAKQAREKDVRFALNDILSVGNMGKYGAEAKASRARKQNKSTLHPYFYRVARIIYLIPFFPEEKICHPIWALCNLLGIVKK